MGFERNPLKSYRELDNPKLLLDTIFYRKSLEVTGINHLVSSSDGEAIAEPLYRGLTNVTFPYVLDIAQKGWKEVCNSDPSLQKGLSLDHGKVICKEILKEMLV